MSACRPSLSLLALALSAQVTPRAPFPVWDRTGHASPGCRPPASIACGAPGERWAPRVAREGRRGAGTRTESILPRRLRLWMLAVVVERPARGPLVAREASRRPGCRGTAPLLEACGGETPWRARAADSRWRLLLNVPGPLAMARRSPTQQPLLCRRRRLRVLLTPAYLAAPRGSLSPSVRPPTPRAAPARRRLSADVVYCSARGSAMPRSSLLWQLARGRIRSLPAIVDRPRARAARPRAGERESASAGHDATGGCPPTRSRAARAGYLRRGTPPCSSMPPRRCSAPRVEPSVGSGPSLPPVRRVSRPPVIASPLLLFVGCCRPVARDPRPARPAPCASLASFHDGSDGKESACNA